MALTKSTKTDRIEVLEMGHLQIRTATIINEDGVESSWPQVMTRPGRGSASRMSQLRRGLPTCWPTGRRSSQPSRDLSGLRN